MKKNKLFSAFVVIGFFTMALFPDQVGSQTCQLDLSSFPAGNALPKVTFYEPQEFQILPPSCSGLLPGAHDLYVTVKARIPATGAEDVLRRLGSISALPGIKYWSISDKSWNVLVKSASALDASQRERGDFTPWELESGGAFYFEQEDNRSSGAVRYQIDILEAGPERIVAVIENVTPVKHLFFTVFNSGAIRSVYVFQKINDYSWAYYNLYGVKEKWRSSGEERQSYVNRAIAMYRYFANIPTDQEPSFQGPLMPPG